MAQMDIYVVGDNKFDIPLFLDKLLTPRAMGIKGVRDMVARIVEVCAQGHTIGTLTIVGHGDDSGQWVGEDLLIPEVVPAWRSELCKLKPFFNRNTHIVLGGCRQGRNVALLLALSDVLNVSVTGYTSTQSPLIPGHEGGETTCFITCSKTGFTAWDAIDVVAIPLRSWILGVIR
jgi:hypothetical protein